MKRILLFGATGRTGSHLLRYALENGYAVTALVRNPEAVRIKSENLKIVKGSPTSPEDVKRSIVDCDVVISALSSLSERELMTFKKARPSQTLERAIQNAIDGATHSNAKRIITLSSIGVGDSYVHAPWYMRLVIRLSNFKIVFADHNRQEELLRNSTLDWTIVRPVSLNDTTRSQGVKLSYNATPRPFTISREQVARFMVDCIEMPALVRKAPIISDQA